uniref:phage tail tape measure protein n=1 Tax=Phocaeicola dorei TaxID=357276 RepID=UPI004026D48A
MGKLVFRVASDWQEVVRLRTEIEKLKQTLLSMDSTQSPDTFKKLNVQLGESTKKMNILISDAAKAGATMENDFKKGIYDGEKAVNSLSEEIIKQKNIIRETQNDVSMLTEKYKKLGKYDSKRQSLSDELNRAKAALGEQKYALGELQSQQALARLSTKALRDEYALFKDESKAVITTNEGVGVSFKKTLAAIGGIAMLKQVASNVVSTAGMFQKYESVLTNALNGSSDKAKAYLSDINSFAAKTNFQLNELTDDFIKFVNRGVTPSMDAMRKMGDFTNTVAKPFDQLTEAILDINNPERWKEFGVRVQTEGNKVKLSFRDMTVECDRTVESVMKAVEQFGSMKGVEGSTEAISKTIEGQMSNLEDTITTALAEIGLANQDLISGSISAVDTIVKNYGIIGKSVLALVEIYGVYRAGLLINTIVEQGSVKSIWAKITATKAATLAQATYNKVLMMNPYVLAGAAVVSLGIAMWTLADNTSIAEKAQERFNKKQEEAAKQEQERRQKIESLIQSSRDIALADLQRGQSLAELRKEYPKIFAQYDIETIKLADILKLKQQIAEEEAKRAGEKRAKEFSDIESEIKYYENLLKSLSGQQGVDGYVKKLKELRAERDVMLQEKGKGISEQFISNLKDVDISEFDRYISELEKRIRGKGENGTVKLRLPIDIKGTLSDEAIYNVKDIKTLIDTAKSVKQTRIDSEKNKTTYKQDYEKAKKDWDDAKKKLSEIEKNKSKFTSKLYEEAKKRVETTEKAYKNLGGITGSSLTKQEKAAEKQKENQEKLDGQLLSLHRQNQQDEINPMREGTEKKLKQIDLDYQKQIDAIRKQEEEWSKAGNGKLTDKQAQKISEAYTNAESMRDKDISDVTEGQLKAEQQALNDYLKEYGTFQQQKLAIAQEYAEKIRKAQEENGVNSAQVKLLEKQRDVAIQNKETEAIKANIDWVTVFGEFGSMFSDMIKPALDEAKKYVRTDKFKNSDQASQKSLIDAISQMEKSLGGTSGVNFKKLGEDVKAYQTAEQNRIYAVETETDALEKLQKAQEDYAKAQKDGTESEKQAATNALETAQQNADIASANVKTQTDIANQAQQNVSDTATKLKASMENILGGLQQLSSGGLYDAYSGIIKTVNGFKDVIGKTSESLKEVPIVGWILSIIDVLKDGLSNLVGGLLDAVLNAVSGIIGDVLSGDLFVTIGESLKNGIGNILNAISFGGFNSLFGIGGNKKEVEEAINRLTDRNETLQTAIEDLTDVMEASKGTKSVSAYADAKKLQKETEENYKKIAQEQARYSNSHHSWNYYWGGFNQEEISRLSQQIGRNWNGDIWSLSPEEMKVLRSNVDMWEKIQNTGKGGYGERLTDKLNDYVEQAGKLEELTDKLYEGLTGITFDGMFDSFVNNLMDMKYEAKDAAEDIAEYFMRAMLSNKIGEMYSEKLEEWWKKFGAAMEDNNLTEVEREALQDEYMKYVEEAMKLRDELAAATGYDKISQESYSQSSSSRGFGTEMTHEDVGELSGRFTALHIAGEEIKNQNIIQSQSLNLLTVKADALLSINTETRNIADDTRDLIAQSYLELVQISENTGAIVKPIQQIQRDIAEVKKNTAKL